MMLCKIGLGIIWLLLECEPLKMAFVHLHQGPRVETCLVMGSLKVCSLGSLKVYHINSKNRATHPHLEDLNHLVTDSEVNCITSFYMRYICIPHSGSQEGSWN